MIHGPPPTWPVTTGDSFSHFSGDAAVICPAGRWRVSWNSDVAYQDGPGISRTLSFAPPYFFAKSGVNTLNGGTVPFLINGSMRLAIRVQCGSFALMRSLLALDLLERALVAPQVDPVAERVTAVADDVTGMLRCNLLPECRPLLPRRRNGVAEPVHELLVDPEDDLGQVVLDAVLRAVDRALRGRRRRPLAQGAVRDQALDRLRELERLLRHPHRVVDLLAEDDVRPSVARPVPQLDLRLQGRRAVGVAVEGDDLHDARWDALFGRPSPPAAGRSRPRRSASPRLDRPPSRRSQCWRRSLAGRRPAVTAAPAGRKADSRARSAPATSGSSTSCDATETTRGAERSKTLIPLLSRVTRSPRSVAASMTRWRSSGG